jgi:hypothetical protein
MKVLGLREKTKGRPFEVRKRDGQAVEGFDAPRRDFGQPPQERPNVPK